jgi:hypothetical protein
MGFLAPLCVDHSVCIVGISSLCHVFARFPEPGIREREEYPVTRPRLYQTVSLLRMAAKRCRSTCFC